MASNPLIKRVGMLQSDLDQLQMAVLRLEIATKPQSGGLIGKVSKLTEARTNKEASDALESIYNILNTWRNRPAITSDHVPATPTLTGAHIECLLDLRKKAIPALQDIENCDLMTLAKEFHNMAPTFKSEDKLSIIKKEGMWEPPRGPPQQTGHWRELVVAERTTYEPEVRKDYRPDEIAQGVADIKRQARETYRSRHGVEPDPADKLRWYIEQGARFPEPRTVSGNGSDEEEVNDDTQAPKRQKQRDNRSRQVKDEDAE